jgi:hypothetical protein
MKKEPSRNTKAIAEETRPPLSIRISNELDQQLIDAVRVTEMKRSDVVRMSIERGLPVLLAQLGKATVA